IIFVDTPGIFDPKRRLDRAMVSTAWGGAKDADLTGVLLDAKKGLDDGALKLLEQLGQIKRPVFLVLNKIDLVKREQLLKLTEEATTKYSIVRTYMISAANDDGVEDLK